MAQQDIVTENKQLKEQIEKKFKQYQEYCARLKANIKQNKNKISIKSSKNILTIVEEEEENKCINNNNNNNNNNSNHKNNISSLSCDAPILYPPIQLRRACSSSNAINTTNACSSAINLKIFQNKHKKINKNNINANNMPLTTPSLRYCVSAPILQAVSSSVSSGLSAKMDDDTINAARLYYEMIANDNNTTFQQKKDLIYTDLVIGTKTKLKMNKNELNKRAEFTLKYKIGLKNEIISNVTGSVITVGRFEENDIFTGDDDQSVSRIQFFMFVIGDSLIILDGWSFAGTKTIHLNDDVNNLNNSVPKARFVLRFNKSDTIHLRLGAFKLDLVINPKECVVCMEKARIIRNKCGHFVLCKDCYDNILSSSHKQCPICRAMLDGKNQLFFATKSYAPL